MFSFVWKRRTDAERVESIRRNIRSMDRMRPWLIASCSLMAVLLSALAWAAVENLAAINPNNRGQVWLGFSSGLVVGSAIGFIAIKLAHGHTRLSQ